MRRVLFTLAFGLMLSARCIAQDLGPQGRTYPIKEPDMLAAIKSRLQAKIDSGEYGRYREDARRRVRERFLDPEPANPLAAAVESRVFYYDPTLEVHREIRAADGNVVVPAGTRVNPLDHAPFTQRWLFIDGRDPRQLAWAKAQLGDPSVRPIFVAGKWVASWRDWQRRTWFDQGGALTRRLGITATPAAVVQEGRRIRIEEVALR